MTFNTHVKHPHFGEGILLNRYDNGEGLVFFNRLPGGTYTEDGRGPSVTMRVDLNKCEVVK